MDSRLLLIAAFSIPFIACDGPATGKPATDEGNKRIIGKWVDLANAPETWPRLCCFFDSTREDPCGPDTLILRTDGSLTFTSVIDEPSQYRVAGDSLYRVRGGSPDTTPFAFSISHDTLHFPVTPLCEHNPLPARFRKIGE